MGRPYPHKILTIASLCVAILLPAYPQTQPKLDEPIVPLGAPIFSLSQAIKKSQSILGELGIPASSVVSFQYKAKRTRHRETGSKWYIKFANGYIFEISGQTGNVLTFANPKVLEALSFQRMHGWTYGSRTHIFDHPPKDFLAAESIELLDFDGNRVTRLREFGGYVERQPGTVPLGEPSMVSFYFDKHSGKLAGFNRSLDYRVATQKPKVTAEKAILIAKDFHMPNEWGKPSTPIKPYKNKVAKGYAIISNLKQTKDAYTNESPQGYVVWVVREPDRETWVDIDSGKVLNGWFSVGQRFGTR